MDPTCVLIFFTFFERILYKSNWVIFIFSWCATHTKIRSKLVVIVTAGSQKITLWGPQRTPLGVLRVKSVLLCFAYCRSVTVQISPLATLNTYLPAVCLIIYTRMVWHARVLIMYGNKGSVVFVHRTLIGTCHNLIMGEVRLAGSWK